MNRNEKSGTQCWETKAKYWLSGSSRSAEARRRRVAAMRVGEARRVCLEGMKRRRWKTPPGETTAEEGSAWM